jgi:hypothetical protein
MKFSFSSIAIGVVAFACLLIDFSLKNWEKQDRVIEWDVHSYYEYLPALFIYDDIKFEKSDYHLSDNRYLFWPVYTDDGRKVIKMTMGTAILYSPFFIVAHAYASHTDYPEDGFSEPYKVFLLLSTIFYLVVGLNFVKKILTHYNFSDKIIGAVILLTGLGTNMLCYASQSAPMSHIYSFCAFSIFIFFTIRWFQRQSIVNTVVLGLLFGLISLIRPTNAVIILFFIFYNISNAEELQQRARLFFQKYLLVILAGICTFLVWIPQLVYWKFATGHFLSYSYGDEGFFFSHPRIIDGLFSFRKGWLIYTPMMLFALLGIFFMKEEAKKLRGGLIVFSIVNVYIIFSWWCWWYGGTFGQRSFIESYSLLTIPFASFIKNLSDRKLLYNIPFYAVAAFFIWLNIFQTYQFEFHSLHHDGMTRELYFKQFGKMDRVKDFDSMVHWANYEEAKKGNSCESAAVNGNTSSNNALANKPGKKELTRKTIQLRASNGKFVCADESIGDRIIANRDSAQGWETFTLIQFENNEYGILSRRNKFFSDNEPNSKEISATEDNISELGVFSLIQIDKDHVVFKNAAGRYWHLDEKTKHLYVTSENITEGEKFEMMIK